MRRVERLAAERDALLDRLAELDPEQLGRRPEAGVWSAAEVVEHMIIAEEYCQLAKVPIAELESRPRSLRQRILYEIVVLVLKGPVGVSTPVDDMDPEGHAPLDELAARWRRSQDRLADVVRSVGDPGRDAVFRHPVAGPMTPAQAIRMLEAHQRRHIRQIEERLGESLKP